MSFISKAEQLPISRRSLLQVALSGALLASASGRALAAMSSPVVKTESGSLRGETVGSVKRFLGVPYAHSIAGAYRFLPPQPPQPWDGIRDAVKYADSAPQPETQLLGRSPVSPAFDPPAYVKSGDDCLALNIWAPSHANSPRPLPVMVWLHGGGWVSGSGSCAIYDGEHLAARGDVIVVTINHRLGASGLTDLSRVVGGKYSESSNLGIRDILAALQWVQKNISAFFGDPNKVTIFGESGGGWKVATLLGIPKAKGLFHKAIIQSGPLTRFMEQSEADKVALTMLEELGIEPALAQAEKEQALENLSADDVVAAQQRTMAKHPMNMTLPGFPTGFWPVLDNDILPASVFDPVAAASSLDIPLMIGQNGTEFSLFMLNDKEAYSLDEAGLAARVGRTFADQGEDVAANIIATYRKDFPDYEPSALWFRIFSDFAMGTLTSRIMDARSVAGAAPVYAYRFDWMSPIADGNLYSPHTMEIPFVFDNERTRAGEVMTGTDDSRIRLSKAVSTAWIEFASRGKPAGPGLPAWPVFDRDSRNAMHLDNKSYIAPYIRPEMLAIYQDKLNKALNGQ